MEDATEKKSKLIAMHDLWHPANRQTAGQSVSRPAVMVAGRRARRPGDELFKLE